jgi:ABC-2 type transport system permease protein
MLGIALLLGAQLNFASVIPLVLLMGLISFSFVALGIAIASTMEDMHGFQLISNFVIMPMFFLSGALFPLGNAPEIIRVLASIDPLTYAVESLRYHLLGYSSIPLMVCVGVLLGFGAICTVAAAYLFNKIES